MDTPESKSTPANNSKLKLINPSSSSDSPAFQDSPVFNFLSNLSPIQQAKPGPVAQGFPGLASPPLVFTSPRINSQTSFLNRKLQSSGSNSKFSQDHDNCQKNERDLGDSLKLDLDFRSSLAQSDQTTCNNEKLVVAAHCSPSVCFDEFLADPGQCANSSNEVQLEDSNPFVEGGGLQKIEVGHVNDVGLDGSAMQNSKQTVQTKSRISVKVVKNKPRQLTSSSECSDALPRFLSDHKSDICQTGDSSSEASHFERGTLRRCLFDESQKKYPSDVSGFGNSAASSQIQESANMSTGKSGTRQMIDLSKPAFGGCMSQTQATGNYPAVISKPLGIGLHLNSVVYPKSTDNTTGRQQPSTVRVEGKNSLFIRSIQSDRKANASNVIAKVSASSEEIDVIDQRQACTVPTADNTIASDAIVQFNNAIEMKLDASCTITGEKRKLSSDLPENNESSPKKKRKKAPNSTDDDTTKRCNCRKTKCLKLYCDCFAAGFYCGESCACQGCFNRPEYEATVLETRQQIESRNPLAFAPKVLQPVSDSPASIKEIGDLSTPSSARHKRGCNCKKSMCLKKYCECYQANVGCSEGCRCEGCKNIYGIREDFSIAREILIKRASVEMSEGTMTVNNSFARSRVHNSPNLVPVTPALQCSDHKKNALKSRLPFRRFLQSSGSCQDTLTAEENLDSPKTSQEHSLLLEENKCTDVGTPDDAYKKLENTEDSLVLAGESCPQLSNTDTKNSNLKNISQPEPLDESGPSHEAYPQSSNTNTNNDNLKNTSQPKSFDESGPPPPSSSSLRWRSSPITPITQLATSELQDFGTVSKQSDLFEDDTPEILKPSSTPVKSVKVSSPNKKRISPPHNHMNSSDSLKSSRKFVLRAVPTFPSLTPYSKNGSQQQ